MKNPDTITPKAVEQLNQEALKFLESNQEEIIFLLPGGGYTFIGFQTEAAKRLGALIARDEKGASRDAHSFERALRALMERAIRKMGYKAEKKIKNGDVTFTLRR